MNWYSDVRNGLRPFTDLPWVAIDTNNVVGIFFSAGSGPIPIESLGTEEKFEQMMDWFDSIIDINSSFEYGYVLYDYGCLASYYPFTPYKLEGRPTFYKTLNDIPAQFHDIVSATKFSNYDFTKANEIIVESLDVSMNI